MTVNRRGSHRMLLYPIYRSWWHRLLCALWLSRPMRLENKSITPVRLADGSWTIDTTYELTGL